MPFLDPLHLQASQEEATLSHELACFGCGWEAPKQG